MNLTKSRIITIGTSAELVRVAQITRSGVVEKLAKQAISKGDIGSALREAVKGFDIAKSAVIWVLPGDVVTAKSLDIPSIDKAEIESILALQAARHTPFSKDEILSSYIRLGNPKPNFTRVLLAVVKRETIKEKMVILKTAGLSMDTFLFAPESIAQFYGKIIKTKKNEPPTALIDVNMQSSNVMVLANGVLLMSRNVPIGIEPLVVDPDNAKLMADEVKVSFETFEHDSGSQKPGRVYFTTSHMAVDGLVPAITESVGIKPESLPYNKYIQGNKAIQASIAKDFADDAALDIISAGVAAAKCQIELIPQEIKEQRAVAEQGMTTLKAGIFFMMTLVFVGIAFNSKVYFKGQFLKQNLVEAYSSQSAEVKKLERTINRTHILRKYLQERTIPLESLRELYRIVPQEIYLSAVNMDDAGTITLQGISESMSKVFNFVTSLEASPLFEGVKTKSTATKKDRGKEVAAFEIVMKISSVDAAVSVQVAPDAQSNKSVKRDK